MEPLYLLDTNILSEQLKKSPDQKVLNFLEENESTLATCSIVIHELQYGMELLEDSKKKKILETYIKSIQDTLPIFEYDSQSAIWHAKEKSRLSKLGKTPTFVDGQIASIAHIHKLKVITKNEKDFKIFKVEVVGF
ncbi:MAG: type II toxin-antitoxin system VapC family toxin [Leptospiraceae bacterium]|nr:type II toxin-antitoxin system VapC family toxin [Leptospiraceae bacterium]